MDKKQLNDLLLSLRGEFDQLCGGQLDFDREYGFICQALSVNQDLYSIACSSPKSFRSAVLNIATVGLTLEPSRKLAYILPRNMRVIFDPSYQGLIHLATNSGLIEWVQAEVVFSSDTFVFQGIGNRPEHVVSTPFDMSRRGAILGYYCVAKTVKGDYLSELMNIDEINTIKSLSLTSDDTSPWVVFPHQMGKKCCIKRAANTWPKGQDSRLDTAIDLLNRQEGFKDQFNRTDRSLPASGSLSFDTSREPEIPEEVKTVVQQLIDRTSRNQAWLAANDYITGRFTGLDLSYARHKLEIAKQ